VIMADNHENERIARIEERMVALAKSAERTEDALGRLADAVADLASIKIDHERHSSEINHLRQRVTSLTTDLQRMNVLQTELDYIKRDVSNNTSDVNRIKLALPNLELASGWVFKGILAVLGILGTSAIFTIFLTSKAAGG